MAERTPPLPGDEVRWSVRRLAPEQPAAGPASSEPLVLSPTLRVDAPGPDLSLPLLLSDPVVPPAPLVLTARMVGPSEPAPVIGSPGPDMVPTPVVPDVQEPRFLRPDDRAARAAPASPPSSRNTAPIHDPDARDLAAPEPTVDPALHDLIARLVREEVRREMALLREELRALR